MTIETGEKNDYRDGDNINQIGGVKNDQRDDNNENRGGVRLTRQARGRITRMT